MTINEIQMRNLFEKIKAQTNGKIPQPGFLRVEQLADGTKGRYTFPVKKSTGNVLAMEQRLDENDAFVVTHVRVRIKQEEPTKPGSGIYQTYVNQTAITLAASEVVAADVESHFNSKLNLVVDNTEKIKALDMSNSRVAPTTQQSAATNRSEAHEFDGFIPLHTGQVLYGSKSNDLNLDCPAYPTKYTQHTTLTTRIYVAVELYGFLIPGGSAIGVINAEL